MAQSVDYTGRAVDELRSAAYYQEIARDCDRCDPRRPVFISLGLRLRGLRLRASGESAALLQGTHTTVAEDSVYHTDHPEIARVS